MNHDPRIDRSDPVQAAAEDRYNLTQIADAGKLRCEACTEYATHVLDSVSTQGTQGPFPLCAEHAVEWVSGLIVTGHDAALGGDEVMLLLKVGWITQ